MNDSLILAIKAATWLASPLGLCLTLLVIASLSRRWRGALVVMSTLLLATASLPWTAHQLTLGLEQRARALQAEAPAACQRPATQGGPALAILLGGSTRPAAPPERLMPDLNTAADRLTEAARLLHQQPKLRLMVSGGRMIGANPSIASEAASMKQLLVGLGIEPDRIIEEDASRTTRENAARVAAMLPTLDSPVILITSATHLPRSVRNFAAAGLTLCPHAADFRAGLGDLPLRAWLIPREYALLDTSSATKEWLAALIGY